MRAKLKRVLLLFVALALAAAGMGKFAHCADSVSDFGAAKALNPACAVFKHVLRAPSSHDDAAGGDAIDCQLCCDDLDGATLGEAASAPPQFVVRERAAAATTPRRSRRLEQANRARASPLSLNGIFA